MSTVAPHSTNTDYIWTLFYDEKEKDGSSSVSGETGSWSRVADLTTIDGVSVYQTHYPVLGLVLSLGYNDYSFKPPVLLPLFAFARYAVPATLSPLPDLSVCMFTCFGYILDDYRVTMTIYPTFIENKITPRSVPFLDSLTPSR